VPNFSSGHGEVSKIEWFTIFELAVGLTSEILSVSKKIFYEFNFVYTLKPGTLYFVYGFLAF
jgi:hypothetical protein